MKFPLALFAFALLAPLSSPAALAEENTVTFGGERYARQPGAEPRFAPPGGADKQIAFRHFPQAGDPVKLAVDTAAALKTKNPAFRFALLRKDDGSEAMLDYLWFSDDQARSEFHALKYVAAGGQGGILAVEYRFGFPSGTLDVEAVRKLRTDAVNELAKFDIRQARGYFGLK